MPAAATPGNAAAHIELAATACKNLTAAALHHMQAWKQTLWTDIKTEEMEEGAKNFVKEVKALPKRVRMLGVN